MTSTIITENPIRVCFRCSATDNDVEFYPRLYTKRPICKPCNDIIKARNRTACAIWKAKHPEEYKAAQKRWYDKNAEKKSKAVAQYIKNRRATDETWRQLTNQRASERSKRLYATDAAHRTKSWAHSLRYNYGLSLEDWNSMNEAQDGRCRLCRRKRKLFVDHCHETGRVRSLLCSRCNTGMGCFEDSVDMLKRAIHYLTSHDIRIQEDDQPTTMVQDALF